MSMVVVVFVWLTLLGPHVLGVGLEQVLRVVDVLVSTFAVRDGNEVLDLAGLLVPALQARFVPE